MGRSQLIEVANQMLAWINEGSSDPAGLAAITSKEVTVPIPYPGCTPDFAGLLQVTKGIHAATSGYKMALRELVVDEVESRVVALVNTSGTQTGYPPLPNRAKTSEWLGVPPTGK